MVDVTRVAVVRQPHVMPDHAQGAVEHDVALRRRAVAAGAGFPRAPGRRRPEPVHPHPVVSAQVVPRRLQEAEAADLRDVVGHRLHRVEVEPRTPDDGKALVPEVPERRPVLAPLLHVTVLPVADDHVARQGVRQRRRRARAARDELL